MTVRAGHAAERAAGETGRAGAEGVRGGVVVAVDVGGTRIKGAVVDSSGRLAVETLRPTPAEERPDSIVAAVLDVVGELTRAGSANAGGDRVRAAAIVVPGVVDSAAGLAKFSANLGFQDTPLRDIVREASGLPVALGHDVGAAGLAERELGATARLDDCLMAVIGTGIAGVIHSGGQALHGAGGLAGELGHIPVWPDGELCSCGQRGCLERYASAAAVLRRYEQIGGEPGLSAGDALLSPVTEKLGERVVWRAPPPVTLSPLAGRAGLLGATLMAWRLAGLDDFTNWRLV